MPTTTSRAYLEIIATDRATRVMGGLEGTFKRFGSQLLGLAGIGGGLYGLKRGLEASIGAAMEQEKAQMDLVAALGGTETALAQVQSRFVPFSNLMQKMTVYSDEQVLSQMAYARNLGVTTDKLEEATKAAIGLAARYRIDLESAMMLVGRASQGQTQSLSRYGIVLNEGLSAQEKFNELLRIGAQSFRLAEAQTKTATGALEQMRNQVNELQEIFGAVLLPAVTAASQAISEYIKKNQSDLQKFISSQVEGVQAIWEAYSWLYDKIAERGPIGGPLGSQMPSAKGLEAWKYSYGTYGLPKGADIHSMEMFLSQTEAIRQAQADYNAEFENWYEVSQYIGEFEAEWQAYTEELDKAALAQNRIAVTSDAVWGAFHRLGEAAIGAGVKVKTTAEEMAEAAEKIANQWRQVWSTIEYSATSALDRMIWEGENWRDAMRSFARDVLREMMRVFIIQPLVRGIGAAMGFPVPVGHAGGVIGEAAFPTRMMPAWAFEQAPRLHAGLMADEFPAILQKGEMVIAKGGAPIGITINNYSGTNLAVRGQPRFDGEQLIVDIVNSNIIRHGALRSTIQSVR